MNNQNHCFSVSELTQKIQDLVTQLPTLWLQAEISNFTAHNSGHWYFTLKDNMSQIRAVMFRSSNQKLQGFTPCNGLEVKVRGKVSVYNTRGEYQIICQQIEEYGKGALQEEFEQLKRRLEKEGLFKREKSLPYLPSHITIISSDTGAAIKDILNILKRRYQGLRVTLVPALVQGAAAPQSLIRALEQAKHIVDSEVLIVTRGGGSLEDLWAFNNEELARALYQFPTPIISAVGHEIDFTICDFVADLRAPTPSAAAELVVKNSSELIERVRKLKESLLQQIQRELNSLKKHIQYLKKNLISPQKKLQDLYQYLDELNSRLKQNFIQNIQLRREKLSHLRALNASFNPEKVLRRGYTLIRHNTRIIRSIKELKKGDNVCLQFNDGFASAQIEKIDISK